MTTKTEARRRIVDYLKKFRIHYQMLNDSGKPVIDFKDLTLYIRFHVEEAPDQLIECSIWFYEDGLEVRGYYSKNAASWVGKHKDRVPDVMQVINFINARVFLGNLLYTPRLYLTAEEQNEFVITTIIPYRFFEDAEMETLEYITCYYPEFLGKVSFPLFLTLLGEITSEKAIDHIKTEIFDEEDL